MSAPPSSTRRPLPLALALALGMGLAVALYPVWNLEGRWFVVATAGVVLLGVAMMFSGHFTHLGLVALLFSVPLAGLSKFTFLDEDVFSQIVRDASLYSGTLGLGFVDLLLLGLYANWLFRLLVLRSEPLPRLERLDLWVGLILLANLLSQWGAVQPIGVFALEHQIKHALAYFYVSRHFRREHLPWLMAAIGVTVLTQSLVGLLQNRGTLPPGLILDKGAGDRLDQQYLVPGIEDIIRATGTLYDSHALGTYLAMLCPFLLVYIYRGDLSVRLRLLAVATLGLAFAGLVFTYSRSAWLGTILSSSITLAALLVWRERHVGKSVFFGAILAALAGPFVLPRLFARLFDAPIDLLLVRFEQFPVAWSIWRENFLFGAGAGNYMLQVYEHNTDHRLFEPVHNVALFIGAEMGLLGVVAFYGLVLATLLRLLRLARRRQAPWHRLHVATGAAIVAYIFDGMSNPIFREPTIYLWFWVLTGLTVAYTRIAEEGEAPRA